MNNLIEAIKEKYEYETVDLIPKNITLYKLKNRFDVCCEKKITMSKCLYYMLVTQMNLEVDYFYSNKWNKFNVNCYDDFNLFM